METKTMPTTRASSPTTPPTSASSTPTGTARETPANPPVRLTVKSKYPGLPFTAYQLDTQETVTFEGRPIQGYPQDWIVTRGTEVVDVLPPASFHRMYEPIETGTLLLTETDRSTLAQMLGHGSTDSSAQLTRAVLKLASLTIGGIKVDFTPLQWEELCRRAEKRGQPINLYMERLVEKFAQDIWTNAI